MDQTQHHQQNAYLQDYKNYNHNVSELKQIIAGGKEKKFPIYNALCALCVIAVGSYFAQSAYYAQQDSQNQRISTSDEFHPLDLDLIDSLDIAEEPKPPSIVAEPHPESHGEQRNNALNNINRTTQGNESKESKWISIEVEKGDSLTKIFDRLNLPHQEAIALASAKNMKPLNYLMVGQKLELNINHDNKLTSLKYQVNRLKSLDISRDESGEFITEMHEVQPIISIRDVTAPIQGNLFSTANRLDIPNRVISKLSGIFRWDIDFARDIQDGDRFSVIFEEKHVNGELMATGEIIAAEFIINGSSIRAIRHQDNDGSSHYYTPEGKSLKKAFMRNPLKFANVTSGFTNRRYHPVLKRWRAHKGVDYGAAGGTPIMTTADGTIKHIGRKGAYGKAIIIKHGQSYTTLYGHMKSYKKDLKHGSKVKQGQIIGYVGRTGVATGNHLHYEFRIAGKHVNPLTVDLPRSLPMNSKELNQFLSVSEKWIERLDALQGHSVASVNSVAVPSI